MSGGLTRAGPTQLVVDERGARSAPLGPLAPTAGWDLDAGVGCFTTGRVVGGELAWRDEHRARLLGDALSLSPDMPAIMGALAALERATDEALSEIDGDRTLRWGLYRDDSGWRWALTLEPPRRTWCDLERRFTFSAVVAEVRWEAKRLDRSEQSALDGGRGQDGAVVLRGGRFAEGTWFNLAAVRGGRWTVPENVFPGLTRQRLLELLQADGAEVTLGDLEPDSLHAADAVVVLSALVGVGMVGAIGTWECGATPAGTALLARLGSAL